MNYRRTLAAANPKFGWEEIPDCPLETFAEIMAAREQTHPEAAHPTIEYRARVFSETAWKSEKLANIKPEEWIPEYSWLYSLALADGTFECSPRLVWAQAYACVRLAWNVEKVAALLDELERVGLLVRRTDEQGKMWGMWAGSEKFLPSPERCKKNRYKTGRRDLFAGAATEQQQSSDSAAAAQRPLGFGVGVGVGFEKDLDSDSDLDTAKSSENDNGKSNPKGKVVFEVLTPTPGTAEPKTEGRRRPVLSPRDYHIEQGAKEIERDRAKDAAALEEFKAELASKPKPEFTPEELQRMTAKKR